jgi:hypothetical protein
MGTARLLPQQTLSETFKERFPAARGDFERTHRALSRERFFRRITCNYAYSQVTLIRKLWNKCRVDNPGALDLLGWADDNEVNGFRIWLQDEHWRIFHALGPITWGQLNDLVEYYFGRSERIAPPNPQVAPQVQQRRRNTRGGSNGPQLLLAEVDHAVQDEPLVEPPAPPAERQDDTPLAPPADRQGEEEAEPGSDAVVTWKEYLSPTYWLKPDRKKQRVEHN